MSHGAGEQLTGVRGDIAVKDPFLTSDLKALTPTREDVTQFWFTGRDLKLRLYRDSTKEPGESLDLVLEAAGKGGENGDDGLTYRGTFRATLSKLEQGATEAKTRLIKGKATCSSE